MNNMFNGDDLEKKQLDRNYINTSEPWEMQSWAIRLRVTEHVLKDVIDDVGNYVPKVKAEIERRRRQGFI